MMTSGVSPPSITDFIAVATATPGNLPPRSPVAYTFVAPYSPSAPATAAPSPPIKAATLDDIARALVRSSKVPVVGTPFVVWAKTQTLLIAMTILRFLR